MERSEPTLVPEWLRSTGSVTGGGNSAHHFASSSSHSDAVSLAHSTRNRSSRSINDKDAPSSLLDRTSSSNSRRISSGNGSTKHPYHSFTRSHRDKNREREKERPVIRDLWDQDCSDPLENILIGRAEKDSLRRSHSMVSRKPSEVFPGRLVDLKDNSSINRNNKDGLHLGGNIGSGIKKAAFEKDFPSLGTEEKQGVPDRGQVLLPFLGTAVQSLPVGSSSLIGGEGWTSALVEVPTIVGNSSVGTTSVQHSIVATSSPRSSSSMSGLNMAGTLSQAPSRAHSTAQLPDKTQRLEELAIKQSRQLIPMTPSMPKTLVHNSNDKSKTKVPARTNETTVAAKSFLQQQPRSSQLPTQSLRSGQARSDDSKTSHGGKFLVLKPVRENGVSSMMKDVSNLTNNAGKIANSPLPIVQSAQKPNNPNVSTIEQKVSALSLNPITTVEKRPTLSPAAQSRSDFFKLMRKKTAKNNSVINSDSGSDVLSPTLEKSGEVIKGGAPVCPWATENGSEVTSNGDMHEEVRKFSDVGEKNSCLNGALHDPDEEEAAFLRSLGWEENAGEDEGLTEEEINAFYQEYMKLRPSLKVCRGMQPKLSMLSESQATGSSRASSELSLSGSESEA